MVDILKTEISGPTGAVSLQGKFYASPSQSDTGTLLVCLPGGGASTGFFDLGEHEGFDYSFVNRMSQKGYALLTLDHPGTASNPLPQDHPFMTPRQSAEYLNDAINDMVSQFDRHPTRIVGVGHSMGGMIVTLIQGQHRLFDAIILMGSSAGGLDWGLDDHERTYIDRPDAFERDIKALTLRKFKIPFPPGTGGPSGKSITFGGQNPSVTQKLQEVSCELFAAGGMMSMTRGSFIKDVQAIDVPMFFVFGDHDIGIPPEDAPKAYINAVSTELMVMENTGHNSLAFMSIEPLCEKLETWLTRQGP